MGSYEVVILDVDGTLVDSNDAHARAWVDALAEHGITVPFDQVRALIGMGGDKLLPRVSGLSEEEPPGSTIADRRSEIFRERYLPKLRPFPSVRPLLERLHGRGLRLVVASSARSEELEPLLKVAGVEDLIEKKTSSSDAEESKPDPDIVSAALKQAGVSGERAVMIGDTPYDIEAAKRAGVAAIAFRSGGWNDEHLREAIAIYDDANDLLAKLDVSPLAR